MLPLLAFGALALRAPNDSPLVTLRQTASVAVLLKELSERAGTTFFTDGPIAKEVLIVLMDDVPLADAMKNVAWATYGRWEKSGGGYRLVRDLAAVQAAKIHYAKWQTREAAATLGAFRARVLQRNAMPVRERWQLQREGRAPGGPPLPVERALAQALGFVRPETTIFLRPSSVAVYCDEPTPAELPFGPGIDDVLRGFNAASNSSSRAAHAVLTCRYVFEQAVAKLTLYNVGGYAMASAEATFSLYGPDSKPRPKEFADEVPEVEVPLSEASKFLARSVPNSLDFPIRSELAKHPDMVERLRDPVRYEPMATFATDAWRAVGKWAKRNVVANVDDAYMTPGSWDPKRPTLGVAFRTAGGYNSELSPGWILARPSLADAPWHHRVDRAALASLARSGPRPAFAQFEAWAVFAAAQPIAPDPYATNQQLAWMALPAPELWRGYRAARLYGSLSPTMRRDWLAGRPVPVADLPPAAAEELRSLAVQPYGYPETASYFPQRPTARFPDGLPREGVLNGRLDASSVYYYEYKEADGKLAAAVNPVWWLGSTVRRLERGGGAGLETLKVREVPRRALRLTASLPSSAEVVILEMDEADYTGKPFTPWSALPADVRQRIHDARQP